MSLAAFGFKGSTSLAFYFMSGTCAAMIFITKGSGLLFIKRNLLLYLAGSLLQSCNVQSSAELGRQEYYKTGSVLCTYTI